MSSRSFTSLAQSSVYATTKSATRAAAIEDALAIGAIHVRAWQAAYRDIMPSSLLDALLLMERRSQST
jgi:hypothetical protein